MNENEMLMCLIALIIGYFTAKIIKGNGFTVGGKYSCSGTTCKQDDNGEYDSVDCDDACNLSTKYTCDGSECKLDVNGEHNDNKCGGECSTNYSCSGTKCVEDDDGDYDSDDCDDECAYSCSGTECVKDSKGDYGDDECDDECSPWYTKWWGILLIILAVIFVPLLLYGIGSALSTTRPPPPIQ